MVRENVRVDSNLTFCSCCIVAQDLEAQADVTTPLRAEEDDFSMEGDGAQSAKGRAQDPTEGYLMQDLARSSLDEDEDGAAATDHTPLR